MMLTYHEIQSADSEARLCIEGDWKDYHQQIVISVYDGQMWKSPDVTLTLEQVIDLRKRLNKWFAMGSLKFEGEEMKDICLRNDRQNTLEIRQDEIEPRNCLRVVAKIDGSMSSWAVDRKTARELADAIYEILNGRRR